MANDPKSRCSPQMTPPRSEGIDVSVTTRYEQQILSFDKLGVSNDLPILVGLLPGPCTHYHALDASENV
jgi:hypothetical protein